jgi:hypothetical protein
MLLLLFGFVEFALDALDASANATNNNPNVKSGSSLAGFIFIWVVDV